MNLTVVCFQKIKIQFVMSNPLSEFQQLAMGKFYECVIDLDEIEFGKSVHCASRCRAE